MKIKTQYDKRDRCHINSGDPEIIRYQGRYNDDGVMYLTEVGRESIVDEIQSHASSVDINIILQRYRDGDLQALQRRQAMYGDFTLVPKTYADVLNMVKHSEDLFNSLPLEEKEKFNFDPAQFLASFGKIGKNAKAGDGLDGVTARQAETAEPSVSAASEKGDANQ